MECPNCGNELDEDNYCFECQKFFDDDDYADGFEEEPDYEAHTEGLMECTAEGEMARQSLMTHALTLCSLTVSQIMVMQVSFSLMKHQGTFQTS